MTQCTSVTLSVIIPAFNAEKTIEKCLRSVLDQTFLPSEILIYNDCSTDKTGKILDVLATENSLVKVLTGEKNVGAGIARTRLLQEATGEYLAFLDSDDRWYPEKTERQLEYMQQNDLDICVCNYEVIDESGDLLGIKKPPKRITNLNMHLANWIPTSMAIMNHRLKNSKTMPEIRRRQDYAFWLILFRDNSSLKCWSVDETLGTYLRSSDSLSSSPIQNVKSNFKMFRSILGYSTIFSSLCLLANIISRIFSV